MKMEKNFEPMDSDCCTYLGSDATHDFYFCSGGSQTALAKYGDEPHEYTSGLPFIGVVEPITRAAVLAVAAGLLTADKYMEYAAASIEEYRKHIRRVS